MDEVVSADGRAVAVSGKDDDMLFRLYELHPGCKGERSSVGCVERVGRGVSAGTRRTADSGDEGGLVDVVAESVCCTKGCVQHSSVSASGTVDVREAVLTVPVL